MFCSNCGTRNEEGTAYCSNCGAQIGTVTSTPVENVNTQPINTAYQANVNKPKGNFLGLSFNIFALLLNAIIAPFKGYNKEKDNFDTKSSFIFAGIVAGAAMIINLLATMINAVVVKVSYWGNTKTEIHFEYLKDVKYLEVIFKNLLIYAAVILAIAGIYFLASMIIKKELKFVKSLAITTISMVPMIIGVLFLGPVFGLIWNVFGVVFPIIGVVYSLVVLAGLVNKEIQLEDDKKVYFFGATLSIIAIGYIYLISRTLFGAYLTLVVLENALSSLF